jgi:hypothetical protein
VVLLLLLLLLLVVVMMVVVFVLKAFAVPEFPPIVGVDPLPVPDPDTAPPALLRGGLRIGDEFSAVIKGDGPLRKEPLVPVLLSAPPVRGRIGVCKSAAPSPS